MGLLDLFTKSSGGIVKGTLAGVGDLSKDIREAITGEPTAEKKAEIELSLHELEIAALKAQSAIITAEASGESWLQRNWRPIVMLVFAGLVCAHWFGFTPENLSESSIVGLLDIVKIGLGGYVIGRSAEKIVKNVKQ